jgi:8-oxo-dGTP pyrophosphatase MutT (NUDIX family)/phosphohistidine phosphatase SixA
MAIVAATVRAAGTVLWRERAGGAEVAVVHRPRYDDWSLPKGKREAGETPAACAVRETAEETGFAGRLGRWLGESSYPTPHGIKRIGWFAARARYGAFAANQETDALRWLAPDQAQRLLSYASDQAVLTAFQQRPADTATVLLVRHAKAGSRSAWTGADAARPLSKAGHRQATALRELLPLYGVTSVYAAPRVRCAQTVAGVAARLGVAISTEPACGDEGQAADPAGAARRLAELSRGPGVVALCGQGGAIPALVADLAAAGGVKLIDPADSPSEKVPSKKGSVWVLSFARDTGRLLAADYLASPLPIPEPRG